MYLVQAILFVCLLVMGRYVYMCIYTGYTDISGVHTDTMCIKVYLSPSVDPSDWPLRGPRNPGEATSPPPRDIYMEMYVSKTMALGDRSFKREMTSGSISFLWGCLEWISLFLSHSVFSVHAVMLTPSVVCQFKQACLHFSTVSLCRETNALNSIRTRRSCKEENEKGESEFLDSFSPLECRRLKRCRSILSRLYVPSSRFPLFLSGQRTRSICLSSLSFLYLSLSLSLSCLLLEL